MSKRITIKPVKKRRSARAKVNRNVPANFRLAKVSYPQPLLPDLPDIDIDLPDRSLLGADFEPVPVSAQWLDLVTRYSGSPPITISEYVGHRQMDVGYAIASYIHPRRFLSSVNEERDYWTFVKYTPRWNEVSGGKNYIEVDYYYVSWDGLDPDINSASSSLSSSSFPGVDGYIWAVYFLVNGIPNSSLWFPFAENYPTWNSLNIGVPIPDYDITLL